MNTLKFPRLVLPSDFDERAKFETELKGYLNCAQVELENGKLYELYFIELGRLKQDLETEIEFGRFFVAESGMVVMSEVSVEKAQEVLPSLVADGFFENLRSIN